MGDFDTNARVVFAEQPENATIIKEQVCAKCGTTLMDIKREGIVGCVNCYKIFADEIKTLILNKQGTINHIGVIPSRHFSKVKIKEKIMELERQKEIALSDEDFVSAESIKNQIQKLKGEL